MNDASGIPPTTPMPETGGQSSQRRNLIIVVVAVALLFLCCCCVAVGLVGWSCGDMLLGTATECAPLFP